MVAEDSSLHSPGSIIRVVSDAKARAIAPAASTLVSAEAVVVPLSSLFCHSLSSVIPVPQASDNTPKNESSEKHKKARLGGDVTTSYDS